MLIPDKVVKDATAFLTILSRWRVTRLNIVPSHLDALLSSLGDDVESLASLKTSSPQGSR